MRAIKYPVTITPCDCHPDTFGPATRKPWHSDCDPQRTIRLSLDISTTGVWASDRIGASPHDLPISGALADQLLRWSSDYDDGWNLLNRPGGSPPEAYPAFWHAHFDRRGDALADRLRAALGPAWTVTHERLMQPADFGQR